MGNAKWVHANVMAEYPDGFIGKSGFSHKLSKFHSKVNIDRAVTLCEENMAMKKNRHMLICTVYP